MKTSITFAFLVVLFLSASAQYHYPPTKMEDSTDTYFGVTYHDPYRWLEHIETPEVETWFKQQVNYTDSILNTLNGRNELIQEWKKLDALQPPKISSRVEENGRIFYRKMIPEESVGKLYYRQGVKGEEVLLFDPSNYITGKTLSIQEILPSYDGTKVAITYAEKGTEVATLKILDVDSRQFLKDSIYPIAWLGDWTFDNRSVFYQWIKSADNLDPASRLNSKMKLHKIGTPSTSDKDFFSNETYPDLNIAPKIYPFIILNEDAKKYIFASEATVQNELKEYYAPIENAYNGKIDWKILCTLDDKIVHDKKYVEMPGIAMIGDTVYAITYKNAKNQKLVATSLKNPDWANAKTIAPEKKDLILKTFSYSKDYLFLLYSDGISSHVSKYNLKTGETSKVKLPYSGTASIFCLDTKTNNCTLRISSWNLPSVEFDYDPVTDIFTPGSFNKPPSYPDAYKNLVVKEVEVKGHDGAMIPLSIIYKKGIKLDNSNVCFMFGYGAYGVTMSSIFSFFLYPMTLATKGVVVAIPHVRGGGAKGEAWYKAGYKTTKPNTWKDFISCAEYLIEKGYTAKKKLAGMGTSAGGILISRAITERPDLFAAAICNVGIANAMRAEFSSNGPVNIPEFGTVKDSVECKALYEMDGMQHVVKGIKYPAVICIGGWNDERVVAWEPGKFAAALQNASTSGKPVLMKVNYDNGHFTEDKNVTDANFADQLAFAMWQCGHPDFQPKK